MWFLCFQLLNFSPPRFAFSVFLLFTSASLLCVYLEASGLDVNFFLVF